MRGILLATCIIFLPFLLVLHDFGWESDFVDGLFNNNQQQRHNNRNENDGSSSSNNNNNNRRVVIGVSEIPTMDLEDVSNNNDDTPDDIDDLDDDVSGIVELVNDDDSFARNGK
jgi:hypothetical protein